VQGKLVAPSWNKDKWGGMVTRSVVVFVVRDGNPKKLKTWSDLLKPGVQIVTPNPFTSGGARWNVMAAYGGALRAGKTPKQAIDYLGKMWKHVVAQPTSAREGLQTFLAGRGDVFLAYENEALFAQKKGQPVQFVIPKATILIENPVAVTSTSKHEQQAKAFVRFLRTKPAQRIFAENGYRPVIKGVTQGLNFPVRPQLFTIKFVGGWGKVEKKFFDPHGGVMTKIQASSGG
jgi:sulfate/thiosulfate transport system substrate-binding protein